VRRRRALGRKVPKERAPRGRAMKTMGSQIIERVRG
jgi:hypothetical protein